MVKQRKVIYFLVSIAVLVFIFNSHYAVYSQEPEESMDMSPDALLNMEVTSVSKVAEKSSQTPAIINIITHEMIRDNGYRTLYDILTFVPGFFPIADVNDKLLGMRGVHASTNQKFLLLLNGRRITENLWNFTDVDYNLSLHNVKQVEIIRSPGSAVYGRAALTAVINVVTFTGEELDGMEFEASLGNYGYKKFAFSYGLVTENKNQIEVWGHLFSSTGQEVASGAEEDGATNRKDGIELIDRFKIPTASINTRFHNEDWSANLTLMSRNYQHQRAANAGFSWQEMKNNEYFGSLYGDRYMGEEHEFLVFDLTRNFKTGKVDNAFTFNYTFTRMRLRENSMPFRDVVVPQDWNAADSAEYAFGQMFELTIESYRAGLEYFGQYQVNSDLRGLWGLEVYQTSVLNDRFLSNYTTTIENNTLIKTPTEGGYFREKPDGLFDRLRDEMLYSAYAELKWSILNNLILNTGARLDYHIKGEDYKGSSGRYPDPNADAQRQEIGKTDSEISPRIALIYQPYHNERLTFKALYNKSFIAPCYFYRYADPSTSYAGGPWLKSETLDNYMIAVQSVLGSFGGKFLYFMNINKDLLTRDNTLTPARYTSLGKLAMQGVETDLFYKKSIFNAFANYSFMVGVKDNTDDATAAKWIMDNNTIKNFPKHFGSFGLTTNIIKNRLSVSTLGRWYGPIQSPLSTGVDAGMVRELDSAIIFNFIVRYQPEWIQSTDINFSIYNLFDKSTMLGGSVNRPYSQAGRWFNFSLIKKL